MNCIDQVKNALLTVTDKVYHYFADVNTDKYIVYAEDNEPTRLYSDNKEAMAVLQGTIDYFTKTENDENAEKIKTALQDAEITSYINSIQYEEETGFIHYEWVWEVVE